MKYAKTRLKQQQVTGIPVTRQKVAAVRQGAEKLEINSAEHSRLKREMAKLRGEAIQARRLAEHIQSLTSSTGIGKRGKNTMDTSLDNRKHAQRSARQTDRRTSGGSSSRSQLSFNPLHPSSELPPEQLIRLLGLETKKTRKQKKSATYSPQEQHQPAGKQNLTTEPEMAFTAEKRPPRSKKSEHVRVPPAFDNKQSNLLIPSAVVGLLAGAAISAYLFLGKTPEPASSNSSNSAINTPVNTKPVSTTGVVTIKKPDGQLTTAAAKPSISQVSETIVVTQEQIQAERMQLRRQAEQRFAEQVAQWEVTRELASDSPQDSLQPNTDIPLQNAPASAAIVETPYSNLPVGETQGQAPESPATESAESDNQDTTLHLDSVEMETKDASAGDEAVSLDPPEPAVGGSVAETSTSPDPQDDLF